MCVIVCVCMALSCSHVFRVCVVCVLFQWLCRQQLITDEILSTFDLLPTTATFFRVPLYHLTFYLCGPPQHIHIHTHTQEERRRGALKYSLVWPWLLCRLRVIWLAATERLWGWIKIPTRVCMCKCECVCDFKTQWNLAPTLMREDTLSKTPCDFLNGKDLFL